MDRVNYLKNPKIYIALAVVLVIVLFFFPNEGKFKYKYQKGRPWIYETLLAPMDFPILKTEMELLKEKESNASKIVPYYDYNVSIYPLQIEKIKSLQQDKMRDRHYIIDILESMDKIYKVGLSAVMDETYSSDRMIIVQRDRRAIEVPASEVFDIRRASVFIKNNIRRTYPDINADSLFNALKIADYLVPNLIYDKNKTDLIHKEAVDYISPTKGMVYTGQLIVSQGEIVTAEIEQFLDSYKAEYELSYGYTGSFVGLLSGHAILIVILLMLIFAVIYFIDIKIFANLNMYYFILTIFLVSFIATIIVRNINVEFLFMVPYAVFALYLFSFFKQSLVFPLYAIILIPLLILSQNGVQLYFMNLIAGVVALISFYYLNKGWMQFLNSFFIFIVVLVSYIGFKLSYDGSLLMFDTTYLFYIAANALFVVAAYPVSFLFEKIFSLVSNSRLVDLSDTNNLLLQELSHKAPGTFQHSLQVSNLAGDGAREIGANIQLAKVGALYHDIGKIKNPLCFVENQAPGIDYHKLLSPIESAQQIIKHVDDGVEIAKKHKLPGIVVDFIKTHHAQTLTNYFYVVYCKSGGDPNNVEPFKYQGNLPTTKEQVIVLMADAVEAASRTLKDYSYESISILVDSIIASRLSDSQLINADISIREITLLKEFFKRHITQIYHERIVYPEISGKRDNTEKNY